METTIYVAPKNLRKNQENCAFFLLSFFFPRYIVYQFDLKENKDKHYVMEKEEFEQHWEILKPVMIN